MQKLDERDKEAIKRAIYDAEDSFHSSSSLNAYETNLLQFLKTEFKNKKIFTCRDLSICPNKPDFLVEDTCVLIVCRTDRLESISRILACVKDFKLPGSIVNVDDLNSPSVIWFNYDSSSDVCAVLDCRETLGSRSSQRQYPANASGISSSNQSTSNLTMETMALGVVGVGVVVSAIFGFSGLLGRLTRNRND